MRFYSTMFKIRRFEEEGVKLYRQGHLRGYFHPYWGQEAIAVGVSSALTKRDYITSTHRGHGHCIAWGADLKPMFSELLGKSSGYCKGMSGSMHIADIKKGNLGANGIVASGVPIGVGAALGARNRGEDRVTAVFVSDGGTNIGSFSEGLNLAATWKLPVLFVIENNQYAVSTPIEQSTGEPELYKRGLGYGVEGTRVDGNDVLEVYAKSKEYIDKCRKGNGPFILEGITFRKAGHHVNDPGQYMPQEKIAYYAKKDPLLVCKRHLSMLDDYSEEELNQIEERLNREISEAIHYSMNSPEMTESEFYKFIEGY